MSEYIQEYNGKLYIYYVKQEDSGEYECQSADGRRDRVFLNAYDGDRPPAPQPDRPDPEQPGGDCIKILVKNNKINIILI